MVVTTWEGPGSVTNSSGLPGCGPDLEPDRMVQSRLLPGKKGSGTGSNPIAVPFYGSYNFGSNYVFQFGLYHDMVNT